LAHSSRKTVVRTAIFAQSSFNSLLQQLSAQIGAKGKVMNIRDFKEGDFIQRTAPTSRIGDHSYCGDRLEFLGFDKGVIMFRNTNGLFDKDVHTLDAFDWDDDNWDYYPESLFQKAKEKVAGMFPAKSDSEVDA
jgi:hypothetical protein